MAWEATRSGWERRRRAWGFGGLEARRLGGLEIRRLWGRRLGGSETLVVGALEGPSEVHAETVGGRKVRARNELWGSTVTALHMTEHVAAAHRKIPVLVCCFGSPPLLLQRKLTRSSIRFLARSFLLDLPCLF